MKFSEFVQNSVETVWGKFQDQGTNIRGTINAQSELPGPLWTFVGGRI